MQPSSAPPDTAAWSPIEMAGLLLERGHAVEGVIQVDTVTVEDSRRLAICGVKDVMRLLDAFQEISPRAAEGLRTAMETDSRLREVVLATNQALAGYRPGRHAVPLVYLKSTEWDAVLDVHAERWWKERTTSRFQFHEMPRKSLHRHGSPLRVGGGSEDRGVSEGVERRTTR